MFTFDKTNGGHNSSVTKLAALENGLFASGSDDEVKIWEFS
jgi:hypothetical protein